MNDLQIYFSHRAVYCIINKNNERASLEINSLNKKRCNNTEYENEHIIC